jgi:hypothetical protein
MRTIGLVLVAAVLVGCGDTGSRTAGPGASQATRTEGVVGAQRAGSIEINGESWTLVPNIQCGVFPGNIVAIAGYAAEDPDTEIVIDYDAERGPIGVRVEKPNGRPAWSAGENDLAFTIDGKKVSGSGTFTEAGRQAQGRFEVAC